MNRIIHSLIATVLTFLMPAISQSLIEAQDPRAAAIIELNRSMLESLIINNDPSIFDENALAEFMVITPGGVVENKAQALAGAANFDAVGVTISKEQVTFSGDRAVLIGKVEIDGEMPPGTCYLAGGLVITSQR